MKIGALRFNFTIYLLVGSFTGGYVNGADASLAVAAESLHDKIISCLIEKDAPYIQTISAESVLDATVYAAAADHERVDDIVESLIALKPSAVSLIPRFFVSASHQKELSLHVLKARSNPTLFKKIVTLYLHKHALDDTHTLTQEDYDFCGNIAQYNQCRFRKNDLYEEIFLQVDADEKQQRNVKLLCDLFLAEQKEVPAQVQKLKQRPATPSAVELQQSQASANSVFFNSFPYHVAREIAAYDKCSENDMPAFMERLSFDDVMRLLKAKITQADWSSLETRTAVVKEDVSFLVSHAIKRSSVYEGSAETFIVRPIVDQYVDVLHELSCMLLIDDIMMAKGLLKNFYELMGHVTGLSVRLPDVMESIRPQLCTAIDNFCQNGLFKNGGTGQCLFWSMMSRIPHDPLIMHTVQDFFHKIIPHRFAVLQDSPIDVNRFANLGFQPYFESQMLSNNMLEVKGKCVAVLSKSFPAEPLKPAERNPLLDVVTASVATRLASAASFVEVFNVLNSLDKKYAPIILNYQVEGRFPIEIIADEKKRPAILLLKNLGIDLHIKDEHDKTLLMRAIDRLDAQFFNFLVSVDQNPDVLHANGSTILEYILLSSCAVDQIVDMLRTMHTRQPDLCARLIGDEKVSLSAWYEARCLDNSVKHTVDEQAEIVKVLSEYMKASIKSDGLVIA